MFIDTVFQMVNNPVQTLDVPRLLRSGPAAQHVTHAYSQVKWQLDRDVEDGERLAHMQNLTNDAMDRLGTVIESLEKQGFDLPI